MRNNYGCDLDSLGTGSRIGMMRTARGDLRYFINGADQGVACSGLPAGKGTAWGHGGDEDRGGGRAHAWGPASARCVGICDGLGSPGDTGGDMWEWGRGGGHGGDVGMGTLGGGQGGRWGWGRGDGGTGSRVSVMWSWGPEPYWCPLGTRWGDTGHEDEDTVGGTWGQGRGEGHRDRSMTDTEEDGGVGPGPLGVTRVPAEVYAVVDLYGQCVQVSLTGATGPADNSLTTSSATEKACPLPSPGRGHRGGWRGEGGHWCPHGCGPQWGGASPQG